MLPGRYSGSMARILVFQHVAREPLGTLDALLRRRGFRIRYVNFERSPDARPTLDRYSGLIVLGGPMCAGDESNYPHLAVETALIREAAVSGRPVLGVCLGAQLLARAFGGGVNRDAAHEVGWCEVAPTAAASNDPLLRHLDQPRHLFQWHSDVIQLPPSAECLARSDRCPVQAFRVGAEAWGFQFHLEVDGRLIRRWLRDPAMQGDLEKTGIPDVATTIERDTRRYIEDLEMLSRQVFGAFADRIQTAPRRVSLPSAH